MRAALGWLLPLAASSCIAPWAVMPGGFQDFGHGQFPPNTEIAQVGVAPGQQLRGVFVPAGPGAPVVLHLLDSTASATLGCTPFSPEHRRSGNPVLWDLQDLGYASLMLDYRGVGASDGERSVDNLAGDARVMWREAVRRAGGDPSRVLIRSTSLGTIATAGLIQEGARPAAWTLIAPVEGRNVVSNVLYGHVWDPLVWLLGWLAQPAADIDVADTLASATCRTLVLQPFSDHDGFASAADTQRFRRAARLSKGESEQSLLGHIGLIQSCAHLQGVERQMLLALPVAPVLGGVRADAVVASTGVVLDRRSRLRLETMLTIADIDPAMAVAAAASDVPIGSLVEWVRWLDRWPPTGSRRRTVAEWQPVFDLEDPSGPLRPDAIAEVVPWLWMRQWLIGPADPVELLRWLPADQHDYAAFLQAFFRHDFGAVEYGGDATHRILVGGAPFVLGARREDARRRLALTLARAVGEVHVDAARLARLPEPLQLDPPGMGCFAAWPDPSPLRGIAPERLLELLEAELDDWTLAAVRAVPDWRGDALAKVRQAPELLDVPVFAAWWWLLDASRPGMPLEWLRLHGPRIRRLPAPLQRNLALNLVRSAMPQVGGQGRERMLTALFGEREFADGRIVFVASFAAQVELVEKGAQDPERRVDRAWLALAGLPSRAIERRVRIRLDGQDQMTVTDMVFLEVWWNGRWIPYPGPLQ